MEAQEGLQNYAVVGIEEELLQTKGLMLVGSRQNVVVHDDPLIQHLCDRHEDPNNRILKGQVLLRLFGDLFLGWLEALDQLVSKGVQELSALGIDLDEDIPLGNAVEGALDDIQCANTLRSILIRH